MLTYNEEPNTQICKDQCKSLQIFGDFTNIKLNKLYQNLEMRTKKANKEKSYKRKIPTKKKGRRKEEGDSVHKLQGEIRLMR